MIVGIDQSMIYIFYGLIASGFLAFVMMFLVYWLLGPQARTLGWAKVKGRPIYIIAAKDSKAVIRTGADVAGGTRIAKIGTFLQGTGSTYLLPGGIRSTFLWRHFTGAIKPDLAVQAELLSVFYRLPSYQDAILQLANQAYDVIVKDLTLLEGRKRGIEEEIRQRVIKNRDTVRQDAELDVLDELYNTTKAKMMATNYEIKIKGREKGKEESLNKTEWQMLIEQAQASLRTLIGDKDKPNKEFIQKYGQFLDFNIAGYTWKFESLNNWREDVSPEVVDDIISEEVTDLQERRGKDTMNTLIKFVGIAVMFIGLGIMIYIVLGALGIGGGGP